mmetsp:Transcript_55613/g.127761  ORF Transcript_55613/g.127761 Transcript_55613/m.127761 type:complete len:221 (+) Transcript_55613:712-1374(+)
MVMAWRDVCSCGLLAARVEEVLPETPHDGEEEPLAAVGDDLSDQTAEEQSRDAVLLDDHLQRLHVADGHRGRLRRRLDDANRVGHRVRDGRRAEAKQGVAREVLGELLLPIVLRELLVEEIVRVEPRVMPDKSRRHRTEGAVEEHQRATLIHLGAELLQAVGALHLQNRLARVNRHQKDTEARGGRRRRHRLCPGGQPLGRLDRVPQRNHPRVCRSIAEA